MKVKVTQSGRTLFIPMDCSLPGSSVHGILQARILECVAISFSRKTECFPLKVGHKARMSASTTPIQHHTERFSAIKKEKELKGMQIEKKE